jgi:hypothetical protein
MSSFTSIFTIIAAPSFPGQPENLMEINPSTN